MEIIKEKGTETGVLRYCEFSDPKTGKFLFSVEVDDQGEVKCSWINLDEVLPETGRTYGDSIRENFNDLNQKAASGELIRSFREKSFTFRTPRIGLCECGAEVELSLFTNTCSGCGKDYDLSGHELAPRSQWGEETGETSSDIMSVDSLIFNLND